MNPKAISIMKKDDLFNIQFTFTLWEITFEDLNRISFLTWAVILEFLLYLCTVKKTEQVVFRCFHFSAV